jgi:two-component system, OmpR family, response regulator CpxR
MRARALLSSPVQTPAEDVPAPRRPTVLVVDDDEAIREVIAEVLRDEGYVVVCAENGQRALEVLRRDRHPDLLLLDLMMPVMSGWEVLEQLKEGGDNLSKVPIVIISATASPGPYEHLTKPIDLNHLLEAVARLTN